MLVPMLMALDVPHYASMSQHMSELQLLHHPVSTVMRIAPVVAGLSVLLFGIGACLIAPSRFAFTALTSAAVAANFISGGLFPAGDALHGLYGIGFFIPLIPACFAAEAGRGRGVLRVSLASAVMLMAYMWLNVSGLDPYRGLTQRFAIFLTFGWYAYASYQLLRMAGFAKAGATSAETSSHEPRIGQAFIQS